MKVYLEQADRNSEPVRLVFSDGTAAMVRIRDIDWHRHRTLTYMDLNGACGTRIVPLDEIATVEAV